MPTADINGHAMYYEVHGDGPPLWYMTGWGTFCHGGAHHLARGLSERGIPNARGVTMHDAAHVVAGREQRQRFGMLLHGFLAEIDGR